MFRTKNAVGLLCGIRWEFISVKLQHKIEIDLQDFIFTGKFDYVEMGCTQEWLKHHFADPDDTGDFGHKMTIWRYGSIELHFFEQKLHLIWCDDLSFVQKSPSLKLKKWLMKDIKLMNFKKVLKVLNQHQVNYLVKFDQTLNTIQLKIQRSQVVLHFEATQEKQKHEHYQCVAFGLSHPDFDHFSGHF